MQANDAGKLASLQKQKFLLKDGDLVEVDADNGTVKIVNN